MKLTDLNESQKHDIKLIVVSIMQAQSIVHTLENMTGNVGDFKREKKKKYQTFIDFNMKFLRDLECYVETSTVHLGLEQAEHYSSTVDKLDSIISDAFKEIKV